MISSLVYVRIVQRQCVEARADPPSPYMQLGVPSGAVQVGKPQEGGTRPNPIVIGLWLLRFLLVLGLQFDVKDDGNGKEEEPDDPEHY